MYKGSMKSRACFMVGRSLAFSVRQCNANDATFFAPLSEYCPLSFWSIIRSSLWLLVKKGMAHSTKCFSWPDLFSSTAFRPVNISKSTTPYPYTSLFDVNRPDTLHETHLLPQKKQILLYTYHHLHLSEMPSTNVQGVKVFLLVIDSYA